MYYEKVADIIHPKIPLFCNLREAGSFQIYSLKLQKCFSIVSVITNKKTLISLNIKAFCVS
jgi:hypothetical protein